MTDKKRANEEAIKAAQLACIKRLCAVMATAQAEGKLVPVNPAAKPISMPLRVKSS